MWKNVGFFFLVVFAYGQQKPFVFNGQVVDSQKKFSGRRGGFFKK